MPDSAAAIAWAKSRSVPELTGGGNYAAAVAGIEQFDRLTGRTE
jgi:hypothetical protein